MVTVLLIIQLSAVPYTPPPKPKELPEPWPAMFAREIEITEEVKRREKEEGKIRIFTLKPHTDVVVQVREKPTKPNFGAPQTVVQTRATEPKYNRRGVRNK